MKRSLLLFLIIAMFGGCSSKVESETGMNSIDNSTHPESLCEEFEIAPQASSEREISFENITFTVDREWIRNVEFSVVPACVLISNDWKPDGIGGRTVNFHLRNNSSNEDATISVFKLEEYKAAFAKYPEYVEKRDAELKSLISARPISKTYGIDPPPHLTWMDAHETFFAKARVVDFVGGAGLLTVTQITQEAYINISNERLQFLFQGFTTDGKYFVEMNFPATLKGLPSEEHDAPPLAKGEAYYSDEREEKFDKYLLKTAAAIDKAAPQKFRPQLGQIEKFIRGFEIRSGQGGGQ